MKRKTSHQKQPVVNPVDEEIAERAYFLWESEGHPIGKEEEHMRKAQMEVNMIHAHDVLENIA